MGKSLRKPVKSFSICFVCMTMCLSIVNSKKCLREISQQGIAKKDLRRNLTDCSQKSSRSGIASYEGELLVYKNHSSLVEVGTLNVHVHDIVLC